MELHPNQCPTQAHAFDPLVAVGAVDFPVGLFKESRPGWLNITQCLRVLCEPHRDFSRPRVAYHSVVSGFAVFQLSSLGGV